jgi:cation diffusion facilitator family transporter
MTSQQKTALTSVVAALVLITLKLATGIVTGSLAFVSEALHSGIDLVAALMTLYALGVSARPPDLEHPWGHGKVEHLAALIEAGILFVASLWIADTAAHRLASAHPPKVDATWWALVVVGVVMTIDGSRTIVSYRASVRLRSAALQSNALHFASDFLGSTGVLVGLVFVRVAHQPKADSVAALFVSAIVITAALRLAYYNADILIDRSPRIATETVREAIAELDPPVDLKGLRVREAGGRYFAEVTIGIAPELAVAEGHAAADQVEKALERVLHGGEVVVHVEPEGEEGGLQEAVRAAAMSVRGVSEIHNLVVADLGGRYEVSLHLKLPGDLNLAGAHEMASQVEKAIMSTRPEIGAVITHLEPLEGEVAASAPARFETRDYSRVIAEIVREATGTPPRSLRFMSTREGLVVGLVVGLDAESSLIDAHEWASKIESSILERCAGITRVIVHTEP